MSQSRLTSTNRSVSRSELYLSASVPRSGMVDSLVCLLILEGWMAFIKFERKVRPLYQLRYMPKLTFQSSIVFR